MEKLTIKIDIDNVLRNLVGQMCEIYNKRYETRLTIDNIKQYDIRPVFKNVDVDQFFFREKAFELYRFAPPCYKALEGLKLLKSSNHIVKLVTNQPNITTIHHTIDWLQSHEITREKGLYESLIFTSKKFLEHGDILIDDCVANLLAEPDNVRKICISHPYNQEWEGEKYGSLYEAVKAILNI